MLQCVFIRDAIRKGSASERKLHFEYINEISISGHIKKWAQISYLFDLIS